MSKEGKKKTLVRIGLFILLAFIPSYLMQILGRDQGSNMDSSLCAVCLMLTPAVSSLLTRLITKEGMKESFLKVNARGNMKIYVMAAVMPIIMGIAVGITLSLMKGESISLSDNVRNNFGGWTAMLATQLSVICASFVLLFQGLGEELGWRGYLTPKLEKLMPSPLAVIVSGIIWGLWHGPLVYWGYNFGTSHSGWVNILMMCIGCAITGFPLTYFTKKTGSVWAAAVCHMLIDTVLTPVGMLFCSQRAIGTDGFTVGVLILIAAPAVFAVIACVLMYAVKPDKKRAA